MRTHLLIGALAGLFAATLLAPPAEAGCGCTKPPPPPAAVRPAYAYAGAPIAIFDGALEAGTSYRVIFASGVASATASIDATAVMKRDPADRMVKPQLVVPLPNLPLGPVRIEVSDASGELVLALEDDQLTTVPAPMLVPESFGMTKDSYQAAVGRDGTLYLSLDLSGVLEARTIDLWANDLPLRFGLEDVLIFNSQGFLMQTLTRPIPGLVTFAVQEKAGKVSDRIRYYRHEFETYYLAHGERSVHAVDPNDPAWHADGTPHIDHDHLIVAIAGTLNGAPLVPGATSPFRLSLGVVSESASSSTGVLTTPSTTELKAR